MVNKKGWLRIVEASIAIVIVFAVLLSVSQIKERRVVSDLSQSIGPLLEEIAKNVSVREKIIADTNSSEEAEDMLRLLIDARLKNPNIGREVKICDLGSSCNLDKYPTSINENVYAGSRIISSVLSTEGEPKKVNLFLWIKQ